MSGYRGACLILLACIGYACTTSHNDYLVYAGTYTGKGSKGIYVYRFNSTDGPLTPIGLAAKTPSPSYFVIDTDGKFLYAVQETDSGAISTFTIDRESGDLTLIQQISSRGTAPCHLSFDRSGRYLMVANYTSGSVAIFPISVGGTLDEPTAVVQHSGFSVDPVRQNGPHAHAILPSPDNRFVAVADLGTDKVMLYPFDEKHGTLDAERASAIVLSPGDGPRHLVYTADGTELYVLNELSSSVTAFSWNPESEAYQPIQTITLLAPEFKGSNTSAEISLHPTGNPLFVSNRGEESIVTFEIEPDGRLNFAGRVNTGGRGPRHFEIDPTGKWLLTANQHSGNLTLFAVDVQNHTLEQVWNSMALNSPTCVRFIQVY